MTDHFTVAIELDADGAHPAAWRAAHHAPDALLTGARIAETVRAADRAGFTAATFDDAPAAPGEFPNVTARIEAVQRAAFGAPLSGGIGLIPVVHAVYSEPFHVATQLASLDLLSSGRAGWIVGVDADERIAAAYGRPAVDLATARATARDAVEVSRRLWDSWEDDAVIRDVAGGRYLNADRLHYANFAGDAFSISGPALIPRPPQGQLVVFGDPESTADDGIDVALVSTGGRSSDAVRATDVGVLERSIRDGVGRRTVAAPRRVLELEVALDSAGVDAPRRIAALDAHTPWQPSDRARFVGTATDLVTLLVSLAEIVDGVRLHPAVLDIDLDELARAVLPELRRAGVFASPRAGDTLRDSFGLERPVNRFATAA